jgi:hypothetical protein
MPGRDRRKSAAVRPRSYLQGRDDPLRGPVADARLPVRRDVSSGERAEARNLECYARPTKELRHIRLAEEISRRMAIIAQSESDQIFASVGVRVGASRRKQRRHS